MRRERALKAVLVLVGIIFSAGAYPLMMFFRQDPALAMMLSLYVTLGIFLLLAARNPSANRSLIAFTAWSSFAHAVVMGAQAFLNLIRLSDHKVETVADLKHFRQAGNWSVWLGMAPDDSPLLLRDIGNQEVYALDWHTK